MPVGKTKDAGWQIGVSRTVALSAEECWRVIEDPAAWLGGPADDVRSFRPLDRVRVGWNGTIVQVAITPAKTGTTVRFHQERLADADERERQRAHWKAVLDRLFG
ncbi:SRPBCC domain-containing protein [soil metagenome]